MNIRDIIMRGFMLHKDVSLKLPERGLVLVTGPNGVGKSSIIEGASFGGWGSTLRGTPPWGPHPGKLVMHTDAVHVERGVTKGGKKSMSWNRLGDEPTKYESATKAEEALRSVLGPYDVWRRTHVFSSHDAAHFTMASDGERKRLLESILGLHRFDAALDLCRADRRKAELEQASITGRLQQLRAQVAAAKERLSDAEKVWSLAPVEADAAALTGKMEDLGSKLKRALADHHAAAEQVRAAERASMTCRSRVNECERRSATLLVEKKSLVERMANQAQLEEDARSAEALKVELEALDSDIMDLRHQRDEQNAALMKWRESLNAAKMAHEHARLALESAQRLAAGLGQVPCGGQGEFATCRLIAGATDAKAKVPELTKTVAATEAALQGLGEAPVVAPFDEASKTHQRRTLVAKLSEASHAVAALAALNEMAKRVSAIDVEIKTCSEVVLSAHGEVAGLAESLALHRSMLEELQEECDMLRQRRSEAEASLRAAEQATRQRQAAKDGVDRAREVLGAVEADLAKDEGQAEEGAHRLLVLESVEQVLGLKGVRAHVLGRALSGIEQAANSWLLRFGLAMSLELKPYTEKKTGGVSDAISLVIDGAGGGYGYKAASGGQRRRIDVALLLALADVASAAQGRAPGTLWMDEVFDALDDEGVEAVCGVLGELSQERAVVVISHSHALISRLPATMRIQVGTSGVMCS